MKIINDIFVITKNLVETLFTRRILLLFFFLLSYTNNFHAKTLCAYSLVIYLKIVRVLLGSFNEITLTQITLIELLF